MKEFLIKQKENEEKRLEKLIQDIAQCRKDKLKWRVLFELVKLSGVKIGRVKLQKKVNEYLKNEEKQGENLC